MATRRSVGVSISLAAVFLILVLAGQYVGDGIVGARSSGATVDAVGRASSSYLTGIRAYAAAVLWNRIDPLVDGYYASVPLKNQRYMLSTISLVEWLDPTFAPAYYVGPWILIGNGKIPEGMAMAKTGVERVPDSGMCRASYAQLLLIQSKDLPGAVEQARAVLDPSMQWSDPVEQVNAYASMEQLFRQAGETALADEAATKIGLIDVTTDTSNP